MDLDITFACTAPDFDVRWIRKLDKTDFELGSQVDIYAALDLLNELIRRQRNSVCHALVTAKNLAGQFHVPVQFILLIVTFSRLLIDTANIAQSSEEMICIEYSWGIGLIFASYVRFACSFLD
jgi:hypothetical protein